MLPLCHDVQKPLSILLPLHLVCKRKKPKYIQMIICYNEFCFTRMAAMYWKLKIVIEKKKNL